MSSRARLRCWKTFYPPWCFAANIHYTSCGRGRPQSGSRSIRSTRSVRQTGRVSCTLDPELDQWQPHLGMCFAKEQVVSVRVSWLLHIVSSAECAAVVRRCHVTTDPAGTALTAVRAAVVRWQPKQLLSTSKACASVPDVLLQSTTSRSASVGRSTWSLTDQGTPRSATRSASHTVGNSAPQSIVQQPPRSRPTTDDRRCIALLVLGCRATLLRARLSPNRGARQVGDAACEPAFWLVFRP